MRWRSFWAILLFLAPPLAAQSSPASPPSAERIRAAEQALAAIDPDRLDRDPAYAAATADEIRVLLARPGADRETRIRLQGLLTLALSAAARHDEAEAAADALIALDPGTATHYSTAYYVAARAERFSRFPLLLERAAVALTDPDQRASFLAGFEPENVSMQLYAMRGPEHRELRFRTAQAFLRLGWPPQGMPQTRGDDLRMIVLERHLERGDRPAAASLAGGLRNIGTVLGLVTGRKFDLVVEGDRVARVRAAIEAEDRATAAAVAAEPEDTDAIVERAAFLRSIGRDGDVLILLMPLMADPALVVARGERGVWLVNEAAFSLLATGETNEAIELMRPLSTMNLAERPMLINTSINFTSLLHQAGRNEEALRESERLAAAAGDIASDYGKMIIWGNAACAAHALGRRAESDRWLRLMEPKAEENRSAMIQTLICRGEMDGAERVLIAAFDSETWREQAILWMQDWDPTPATPVMQRIRAQFEALRARPAVQAAFARVGHRLRLPLPARIYGF